MWRLSVLGICLQYSSFSADSPKMALILDTQNWKSWSQDMVQRERDVFLFYQVLYEKDTIREIFRFK